MSTIYNITPDIIEEIIQVIIEEVNPEQIILFGSRAKDNFSPDSDLDLMVIEKEPFGKNRSRRKEAVHLWEVLSPFRIPIDILVFAVEEVEQWRKSTNHVIARAVREGKVLYNAA